MRILLLFVLSTVLSASELTSTVNNPSLSATARQAADGDVLHIDGFKLLSQDQSERLTLTRFQVYADDFVLNVHGDDGTTQAEPPNTVYYRGEMDGVPEMRVLLAFREDGRIEGLANMEGRYWVFSRTGDDGTSGTLEARYLEPDRSGETSFRCDSDLINDGSARQYIGPASPRPEHTLTRGAPTTYGALIAVETDYEYFADFGNVNDASDYVADLIAYGSIVYSAEVDTSWTLGELSLWTTPDDPWDQNTTRCVLAQFGRYWNDNRSNVTRTIAHFISGKNLGGGVAWVGVLCNNAFFTNISSWGCSLTPDRSNYGGGYGVSASLRYNFNINNPSSVWDIVVVLHEIGHNFNSPHTHCYNGLGGNPEPIDECWGTQSGCYSGPASLPEGCSGSGCGTIMSYCHQRGGGISNIALTLGLNHPHGTAPERVPERMAAHVASVSNGNPSCIQNCFSPSLLAQPTAQVRCRGESVTFTVSATGTNLTYTWLKNGTSIPGAPNAPSYTLNSLNPTNAGLYSVRITNTCGTITSAQVPLTIRTNAVVTTQPVSQTVCLGESAVFTTAVSGSGPFTYQWQKSGSFLPGETSATLTITDISPVNAGNYSCVITGPCNQVVTATSVLTVINSSPDIEAESNGPQGLVPVTLSADLGCQPSNVSWFWRNTNTGEIFGMNTNPVQLQSMLNETTLFEIVVDNNTASTLVLVSQNGILEDANGDGCNSVEDIYYILDSWRSPSYDADNDGINTVLDYLYINLNAVPCPL